jgi:hypothetical protein
MSFEHIWVNIKNSLKKIPKVVSMNKETSQLDDSTFSRVLTIEDFLEPTDSTNRQTYRDNKHDIPKNQQEFGHRKRIKP